jgi:hypothetical protein
MLFEALWTEDNMCAGRLETRVWLFAAGVRLVIYVGWSGFCGHCAGDTH